MSARKQIAVFYALALALSWSIWAPWVLSVQQVLRIPPAPYLHLAGSLGPAVAALLVVGAGWGDDAIRRLLRRTFTAHAAREAAIWAVAVPALAFGITAIVVGRVTGQPIRWRGVGVSGEFPALSPPAYALASLLFFGFGEEIGWRGFLYPTLARRWRPPAAALLVVPFWAVWHAPLFFASDGFRAMGLGGAVGWLASLASGALLTSWLTDRARGSVLPAAVFHAALDICFLAPIGVPVGPALGAIVTVAGVAVAIVSGVKARRR